MPRTFPIPREHIPKLDVSEEEQRACRRFMDHMLTHTVREFEMFAYRDNLVADRARWKPQASHDELRVFREREHGATAKQLQRELCDCLTAQPALFGKTHAALAPPTLLLSGVGHGRVENAMEAVVTQSQQELALVVIFMHDQVADCAIVHTIEPPEADKPFHFLGFKYFVKRSPTDPHIIKHRHSLYLESTGMTMSSTGERLGFHVMHSVRLPRFPDLSGHQSIEALQSIRYIYRQRGDKLVEVFALANMDLAGMIARPLSNYLVVGAITGVVRLLDLAEARRLTAMARQDKAQRRTSTSSTSSARPSSIPPLASSAECGVCHDAGGRRNAKRLSSSSSGDRGGRRLPFCRVCGRRVCARCQATKRIFYGDKDGVMGEFRKVTACTACVATANASRREFQLAVRSWSRVERPNLSSVGESVCSWRPDTSSSSSLLDTDEKHRDRSPRPERVGEESGKAAGSQASRRDWPATGDDLHDLTMTVRVGAASKGLLSAETAAGMELRQVSAASPPTVLMLPAPDPEEVKAPMAASGHGTGSPPPEHMSQLWARLQQLRDMAESTHSLTQRNAAIFAQHGLAPGP